MALFAFLFCASAHAAQITEKCPWLNAATAAGVLGGEVRMSVTADKEAAEQPNDAPKDASCEFTPVHGGTGAIMRITVHTMKDRIKEYAAYTAACGASAHRVAGVGNEAIGCTLQTGAIAKEQIVGRVRQRAFVLSLSMPGVASDAKGTQVTLDKLQNTAEQIAGSLF